MTCNPTVIRYKYYLKALYDYYNPRYYYDCVPWGYGRTMTDNPTMFGPAKKTRFRSECKGMPELHCMLGGHTA